MEYKALTGLSWGQLTRLSILVLSEIGSLTSPDAKKPPAVNLMDSVAVVVMLMRRNVTQEFAGGIFGCSQPTVSRRWDLLRSVIGKVLAAYVPRPVEVLGIEGTALVDGTICPTWDWDAIPDLYSGKAKYPGINVQIAANLKGDVAAIGPVPVHGARHDAYAYEASGLKEILDATGDPAIRIIQVRISATSASKASGSCQLRSLPAGNYWSGSVSSTGTTARSALPWNMPWQR